MTNQEIVQALRCSATRKEKEKCEMRRKNELGCFRCFSIGQSEAANLIEQMTAESVVLPDGQASAIESLHKEIEWKDMVIALAQRKQAEAEAARDALLGNWISVDEKLPAPGTRVIATDGVYAGEVIFTIDCRWGAYDDVTMHDCIGSVITHWMPLPPVPKGDAK